MRMRVAITITAAIAMIGVVIYVELRDFPLFETLGRATGKVIGQRVSVKTESRDGGPPYFQVRIPKVLYTYVVVGAQYQGEQVLFQEMADDEDGKYIKTVFDKYRIGETCAVWYVESAPNWSALSDEISPLRITYIFGFSIGILILAVLAIADSWWRSRAPPGES